MKRQLFYSIGYALLTLASLFTTILTFVMAFIPEVETSVKIRFIIFGIVFFIIFGLSLFFTILSIMRFIQAKRIKTE